MRDERELLRLGEDDFLPAMEGDCAAWRKEAVQEGTLTVSDGTTLHYYTAVPEEAKGAVVLVHGLCEFFGKYHEYAWMLYRAGYAVFFCEQRGHGQSGGKLAPPDDDVVYIDDYATYVEDLHTFVTRVVLPATGSLPRVILGHSMGGAVTARYLETHTDVFCAALFSSPMFRLKAASFPYPVVCVLDAFARLTGKDKRLAPGERHFDFQPVFETSSALSKARYDYCFMQREQDRAYRTYGSSLGWVTASLKAIRKVMADGSRIRIPVTLFSAGKDRLVAPEGYDDFVRAVPQTRRVHYEASGHEIFNADTETRQAYFAEVLRTLDEQTKQVKQA